MDIFGNRFHIKFIPYAYWFMSIRFSQMKDYSISVDQARYATSIVDKYLDTPTVKKSTHLYNTNIPYDIILTKDDLSTSDEHDQKFSR